MWDLNSPIRYQTHAPYIGSVESFFFLIHSFVSGCIRSSLLLMGFLYCGKEGLIFVELAPR